MTERGRKGEINRERMKEIGVTERKRLKQK